MLYFLSGCSNGRLELAGNDCFTSSGNILNQIIEIAQMKEKCYDIEHRPLKKKVFSSQVVSRNSKIRAIKSVKVCYFVNISLY